MRNYVLICADVFDSDGQRHRAEQVADARLAAQRWPIYPRTPNCGAVAAGDRFVVYLGGSHVQAKSFYARGVITGVERPGTHASSLETLLEGNQPAIAWLLLGEIERLYPRVGVRELIPDLRFVPVKIGKAWGLSFASGVRSIDDEDWNLIVSRPARISASLHT